MQSITALAHLKACILYFIDISETTQNTIDSQINLFNGIKELFQGKPMVMVMTKTDLKPLKDLSKEDHVKLQDLADENNAILLSLSNVNGEGIFEVKKTACDILTKYRQTLSKEVTTGGILTLK